MVKFQGKNWNLYITRNMSFFHDILDRWGSITSSRHYGLIERTNVAIVKDGYRSFLFEEMENSAEFTKKLVEICLSEKKVKKWNLLFINSGKSFGRKAVSWKKMPALKILRRIF